MTKDQLFSGESKNIEYKVTVPDKSEKYMKTVVAFANGRGGRIVFGIDGRGYLCTCIRYYQTCRGIYVKGTDSGRSKSLF